MRILLAAGLLLTIAVPVWSHCVITYPGWRGDNLITNASWPYGMQWAFPCGGTPVTTNRTYWATNGGALAFQPGWFTGHLKGTLQVNLGLGTSGPNGDPADFWSTQLVPRFGMLGPSNNPFPGTVCLPHIEIPSHLNVTAGQNATIQVILTAQHGASLFSCSDITFVEPGDSRIPPLNSTTCFNSTDIGFADIFTLAIKQPFQIQKSF